MLARIVRDADTQQLTWQRITGDAGSAGATPLGSVLAYFGTTVPEGFLPCNGAAYDVTQYPELYAFLNSSTLPDLRECALVGIGENSTDTLSTHDIYTLGQFKDFATAGFSSAKTAGYTISGNSVILNSTVNASNRKLVTQYVADADATDLQNLQTSSDTVTRMRSKGVNWIIKAIPGMETTEVTDAIEAINEKLAKALVTKDVLTLPTGADIEGYLYHYQGHYYVPHIDEESPTQSYLTELANLSDLQPVDAVTNGDMHPVTSNAVYDELNKVEIRNIASLCSNVISCEDLSVWATKLGRVVTLRIQVTNAVLNTVSGSYDTRNIFTLPDAYRPMSNTLITWMGQALNGTYCGEIGTDGVARFWQWGTSTAPGTRSIVTNITFICA